MLDDTVELIMIMSSIEVDSTLVKIWHDQKLSCFNIDSISNYICQTIVKACLERASTLNNTIVTNF